MPRLYFRFYVALLVSLAVFALAVTLVWQRSGGPLERSNTALAHLMQNALASADAPPAEQQAALERMASDLNASLTLYGRDWQLLAAVGEPIPPHRWRQRGAGAQPCKLVIGDATSEGDVGAELRSLHAQSALIRAVAGQDKRPTSAGAGLYRNVNALVGRKPGRTDRVLAALGRGELLRGGDRVRNHFYARALYWRSEFVQTVQRRLADDQHDICLSDHPRRPGAERAGIDGSLGARAAAAVEPHARARVATVAAGAVVAGRVKAGTGSADEAVLVERENGPRAGLARSGESAPSEGRQQVVAMDHASSGARDRVRDFGGIKTAAGKRQGRFAARKRATPALQKFDLFTQILWN